MKRAHAKALLAAIRRAGDELAHGLHDLRQKKPRDLRRWELAWARAMGGLYKHLLEPLLEEFPEIAPESLGGPRTWSRKEGPPRSSPGRPQRRRAKRR